MLKNADQEHSTEVDRILENPQPLFGDCHPVGRLRTAFVAWARLDGCVWLDSSLQAEGLSRYSYISAAPFQTFRVDKPNAQAITPLMQQLEKFYQPKLPILPPMQGGC